jgi:hypothetical protein
MGAPDQLLQAACPQRQEMSSKDELKRAVCDAIDRHADTIIDLGETILRNPETGFNEVKTAALVAERMSALGLAPHTGLAITGVKGRLAGSTPGPRFAFIGELDSLRTSEHPLADPITGAAMSRNAWRALPKARSSSCSANRSSSPRAISTMSTWR